MVVGAGSSRAEAKAQNAKVEARPPLDTDFFRLSKKHAGLETHRKTVQQFVSQHFGMDCFAHPQPRMEEVFSLVYTCSLGSPVPAGARDAFFSLCRIYVTVIANTTNGIDPTRKGPLCRLLYAALADGETTVLTFNQDILIEKALHVLASSPGPASWFPNTGYAMSFQAFTNPRGGVGHGATFSLAPGGSAPTSSPVVLKPHGSLNWFVKTRDKNAIPTTFKAQKINCTRRRQLSAEMTYTTGKGKGRRRWYTWPIIVPPVLEKGAFLGAALADVWQHAWDQISMADRVILYGYSFPETDAQTRAFFLRAGKAMSKRPLLITINPDATAALKSANVFRPRAHLVCRSVADLLRDAGSIWPDS